MHLHRNRRARAQNISRRKAAYLRAMHGVQSFARGTARVFLGSFTVMILSFVTFVGMAEYPAYAQDFRLITKAGTKVMCSCDGDSKGPIYYRGHSVMAEIRRSF